ncbi:MAG: ATP-binding protein [Gemmatimonadota bacterium]|nr:ATP-binding protein [Gemmatimonadota bacterium]
MRMLNLSVRARLAIWHTVILAALLGGSAALAVTFVRQSSGRRTDSDLADAWSAFRSELIAERSETPSLAQAAHEALGAFHLNNVAVVVFDSNGTIIGLKALGRAKGDVGDFAPPFHPEQVHGALGARFSTSPRYVTLPDREGGYRVYSSPVSVGGENGVFAVAMSLHQEDEALEEAISTFAIVAPMVLALAYLGGWFLAGRSLSPVGAMSERAARISASTTSERLPVVNPDDELGKLAIVLNDLLDRLADALAQQRRFMTDASHELRTPVAVVRAVTDVVLSQEIRSETDYRDALATIQREAGRLSRVVDDLFLLSRADIGERPVRRGSIYLSELISDSTRDLGPLAAERGITIECNLPEEGCPFEGDEELLDRVFGNLIDNAIKYSPRGSHVRVALADDGRSYETTVEDEGQGVPLPLRDRIFERFFRVNDDDFSVPGAGLGLSIARWAVEAHGGSISVEGGELGGAKFIVLLPRSPRA